MKNTISNCTEIGQISQPIHCVQSFATICRRGMSCRNEGTRSIVVVDNEKNTFFPKHSVARRVTLAPRSTFFSFFEEMGGEQKRPSKISRKL